MAYKVKLKPMARIMLMGSMNEDTNKLKPLDPQYKIACDLYEKIYISDEDQEKVAVMDPKTGQKGVTGAALLAMPEITVTLTFDELGRLEKALTDYNAKPADRKLWWQETYDRVQKAKEPDLEDASVRQDRLLKRAK